MDINPLGDAVFDLYFLDEDHGYYTGWSGGWTYIAATQDGGASWTHQYSDTEHDLEALQMIDVNTGFGAGSDGLILKTTNGGNGIQELDPTIASIRVHPNPASDQVTIEAQALPLGAHLFVEMLDATGRVAVGSPVLFGNAQIMWPVPQALMSGLYTLLLRTEGTILGRTAVCVVR